MSVDINIWAVLLAFVSSLVVGSIWYSKPVFGAMWMKMIGLTDKKAKDNSTQAFAKMIPFSLLEAYLLAFATFVAATFYSDRSWLANAMLSALVLWLVQTTAMVIHDSFELRPNKLTLIHVGNQLATLLSMGLIIGLLEP